MAGCPTDFAGSSEGRLSRAAERLYLMFTPFLVRVPGIRGVQQRRVPSHRESGPKASEFQETIFSHAVVAPAAAVGNGERQQHADG